MGWFNRRSAGSTDERHGTSPQEHRAFGHAALDPGDIDDARRGHPSDSLHLFAARRGLDFVGGDVVGAFVSTLPVWPDYVFNLCRGVLPEGRFGAVAHELFEAEAAEGSVRDGGTYYDVRVTTRRSMLEMVGLSGGAAPNQPFAGNAVWIPTTTVHVRVPETNQLPVTRFRKSGALLGSGDLRPYGLDGYTIMRGKDDPAAITSIAQAAVPWLQSRNDRYTDLRVRYGTVALTVNGYRSADSDLDHLVATAEGIAHSLAHLAAPAAGLVFDAPGPHVGAARPWSGITLPHPAHVRAYEERAAKWNVRSEDAFHLTRMLPRCPIPGIASGVVFGEIPGLEATGRVVWFEQGGHTSGSIRGGVIVPADPGASTPVGGQVDNMTATSTEIIDGLAYCWRQQRTVGALEADDLVQRAATTLRSNGFALG